MKTINDMMMHMGVAAKVASRKLANASTKAKNKALLAMAFHIRSQKDEILEANRLDLVEAHNNNLIASAIDRLLLNDNRIEQMAEGLELIASLKDPVGAVIDAWQRPNGLEISRVRQPLGVIGVIYESRPNVTADAAALTLKAGNAVILRGGSDSLHSSRAIMQAISLGLKDAGLPTDAVQLVPTTDRECVGLMLKGLNQTIDVIIPRGGKSLVSRVQEEARVPVFAHLDGNCHVYVHDDADIDMALAIVKNAKLRRTGVCGAAETLLTAPKHAKTLVTMLLDEGCELRGCAITQSLDARVKPATDEDYFTEYLDKIIAVKVIENVEAAISHINHFSSSHTESIVTNNQAIAEQFLQQVQSAIVLHNASTQFADGGEFGFGAEIGIATGKIHARGPVGVEQLTTFNYRIRGKGQIRP